MQKKLIQLLAQSGLFCMLILACIIDANADHYLLDFSPYTWHMVKEASVEENSSYSSISWLIDAEIHEDIFEEYALFLESESGLTVLERFDNEENGDFTICYAAKELNHPGLRFQENGQWVKGCHVILMLRHSLVPKSTLTLIFVDGLSLGNTTVHTSLLPSPMPTLVPTPTPIPTHTPNPSPTPIGRWEWVEVEKRCSVCGGSGKCVVCHGMGYISLYGQHVDCDPQCSSCGGTGSFTQREYQYVIH